MQTFEHKGHTITVEDNGLFTTMTNQGEVTATSLAAMKKKIDAVVPFSDFSALDSYSDNEGERIRVVGVKRPRATWQNVKWQVAGGKERLGMERNYVYADTPENHELLDALRAMRRRHEKAAELMRVERTSLEGKITKLYPPKE